MATSITYSTHAFNFTVVSSIEFPDFPSTLVAAVTVDDTFCYDIPSFNSTFNLGGGTSTKSYTDYIKHHSDKFAFMISHHFLQIDPCCATLVVDVFRGFINEEAGYSCTRYDLTRVPFYRVKISFDLFDEMSRAVNESFEEGVEVRAASVDSVNELLAIQERRMDEDWSEVSCVMCLDEIKMSPLEMPCCHVFHKDCLLKWLQASYMCPLCRFELPVEPTLHELDHSQQ